MPSSSKAQHRAMEAAKHGHSTIGIPKTVGEEYVKADEANKEQKPTKNKLDHYLDGGK